MCLKEDRRYNFMSELRRKYITLCKELNIDAPRESFNRFLFERGANPESGDEPLLPRNFAPPLILKREIMDDLPFKINYFPKNKDEAVNELTKYFVAAKENSVNIGELPEIDWKEVPSWLRTKHKELEKEWEKVYGEKVDTLLNTIVESIDKKAKEIKESNTDDKITLKKNRNITTLKSKCGTVKVKNTHFYKLKKQYIGNNFITDLYIMLRRYDTLFGNTRKFEGGGLHSAIPPKVMSTLTEELGIDCECFANPMNSNLPNYFSLFKDTDAVFGSSGSFFDSNLRCGSYEANPPFEDEVMMKMFTHMEKLLTTGCNLLFFVVVPNWEDASSIISLKKSKFAREIRVHSKGHTFVSGLGHKEGSDSFSSVHDTLVIILSSEDKDYSKKMNSILSKW